MNHHYKVSAILKKPFLILSIFTIFASSAFAGVFTTAHFVNPGNHAIGLEPEVILSDGSGVGANLRYTYGATELNNLTLFTGTGGGPRRFRFGSQFSFDFFPDIDKQPGLGIAAQAIYYRLPTDGMMELSAIPYIHKAFGGTGRASKPEKTDKTDSNPKAESKNDSEIEPFLAFPFGMHFTHGRYEMFSTLAVGALFQSSEHFQYVTEIGVNVNHSETYVSGGVVFYP